MKLLVSIPTVGDLAKAYSELQAGSVVTLEKISEYLRMSRFDARLFEVLAGHLAMQYKKINPFELNAVIKDIAWASALGAILNHSRLLVEDTELFDPWMKICLHGIPRAPGELYFLGLFDFNVKRIAKIISRPSSLFKEWGYFHDEIVLNKSESINRTAILKKQRIKILKKLLQKKEIISAQSYRRALNYQVSIRQAQRDIKELLKQR